MAEQHAHLHVEYDGAIPRVLLNGDDISMAIPGVGLSIGFECRSGVVIPVAHIDLVCDPDDLVLDLPHTKLDLRPVAPVEAAL